MVISGANLFGSFTGSGIWKWDGTSWSQVTPSNPEAMVASGSIYMETSEVQASGNGMEVPGVR